MKLGMTKLDEKRTPNKFLENGVFVILLILLVSAFCFLFLLPARQPMIIVVTPTYKRLTRIPDLLRMANTLAHVKDLHWIVIEDGPRIVPAIEKILKRTNLPYTYIAHKTAVGYPKRGWYQRTMALRFIRSNWEEILGSDHTEGILYFGDDDNSYDIRLFTDYIRNVKKLGMWAVGLMYDVLVEAPKVTNGTVTGYNVVWHPTRKFAVDMAGYAVNLKVILNSTAVFGTSCQRGKGSPETCFLDDLGLEKEDIEPFGCEGEEKEILAWHTQSKSPTLNGSFHQDTFGYYLEI